MAHDRTDSGGDVGGSGVHHQPIVIPLAVVALNDVLPRGKRVARDVRLARFDAAPVFDRIGADNLDVEDSHAGAFRLTRNAMRPG
jgi:hypothetical protein